MESLEKTLDLVALMQIEIEQLRKDAERYRWLRDDATPYEILVVGNYMESQIRTFYGEDLDAAVDAAINKEMKP